MKSKKLLSLLLALMMMLSVVPFYASAAETLSSSSIQSLPTAQLRNPGETIYYGATFDEIVIINDDEVVVDSAGNQVAGHFVLSAPNNIVSTGTVTSLKLTFVPDDTTTYAGFSKSRCRIIEFTVEKTTPVPVDENDTVPVATEVNPGDQLRNSTLSGARYINPYNAEEPEILAREWTWSNPDTIVNESGYYEARFIPANYTVTTAQVYVKVKENTVNTTISEAPTVGELTYDANRTWADVTLTGGKAVEEGTETEVAGTFAVTKVNGFANNFSKIVTDGDTVEVTFTPDDTDKYISSTTTITVTVNKAPIKFLDENGNEVVPEYTIPYGYRLSNYEPGIFVECKKYLNTGDENIRLYFSEEDSKTMFPVGTHELTIGAAPYYTTSNYLKNDDLRVKITVEPKTLNPKICSSTEGYYVEDSSAVYKPKGTFDVYVNDELIASGVAYNGERIKWEATENGTYTMKFVYNPVENDNFIIDDVTTTMNIIFPNTITYKGMNAYILGGNGKSELYETTERTQGTSVTIGTNMEKEYFGTWVITDADGNAVDLGIADLTATEITFTMPDYDIIITCKTALEVAADNCDHLCHSDFFLAKIVWKILNIIFRLFDVQQYCDCGNLHYDAPYIDLGL